MSKMPTQDLPTQLVLEMRAGLQYNADTVLQKLFMQPLIVLSYIYFANATLSNGTHYVLLYFQ